MSGGKRSPEVQGNVYGGRVEIAAREVSDGHINRGVVPHPEQGTAETGRHVESRARYGASDPRRRQADADRARELRPDDSRA